MKKSKRNKQIVQEEPGRDYCIYILISLVVLGSILRLYHLGFNSLWLDEISTYKYSIGSFTEMWGMMATGTDYSPPLFFFMEHFVLQVLGVSEWAIRLLPAIFSIATIPVMYLVGKEFQNKCVGLISAAIFTFSPFLIYYAQDARPYPVAMFFVTAMFLFYLKATKSGDARDGAVFGALAALAFWTHYYTLFFTAALLGYTIIKGLPDLEKIVENIKETIIPVGVLLLLTSPLIISLVPVYMQRTAAAPTYGIQGAGIVYETIKQMSYFSDIAAMLFIIVWLIIVVFLIFDFKEREKGFLLVWIMTVMFIISIVMSYKLPMLPRYLIFLMIPFSLGISTAYCFLRNVIPITINPMKIVGVIIAVFAVIAVPYYLGYYQSYSKEDWRGISTDLESITVPGDTVVNVPLYIGFPLDFYYNSSTDQTIETGVMGVNELDPIRKNSSQSVYYILTPDIYAADPEGRSVDWLKTNAKLIRNYGSVWILKGV